MYLHSIAPKELIRADYDVLKSYEHLNTTPEIEDLLFIQSLEGRSHNGSGVFDKRTYVNTTIHDAVLALGRDPEEIQAKRQALIDDIFEYAFSVMNGERRDKLVNKKSEPFLGIRFFHDRRVNARDVLRGLYLGGLRDNPDIRKEAERIYQIKIGGGRCHVVDIQTMLTMGLDGQTLAHQAHEDDLEEYQRRGLIVAVEGRVDMQTQRYFYIRHRLGPGQSDDAAFVMAGLLYNSSVALGVFLADAIDTLEKYAPIFKDQDGGLSYEIVRGFRELQLTSNDVYQLAYLSAIPETEEQIVPDSSLRYLLSIDQRTQTSALESHLDFIEGRPVADLPVSFKRVPSTQFYEYINRRLVNVHQLGKFAVPRLTVKDLARPAVEISRKEFAVVAKDASVADVVKKFKESKCEIVVVVDKNNRVLGTISPFDLPNYQPNGDHRA